MLKNLNYIFKRSSDKMLSFIWWYFRMELQFKISHYQSLFKPLIDCWFTFHLFLYHTHIIHIFQSDPPIMIFEVREPRIFTWTQQLFSTEIWDVTLQHSLLHLNHFPRRSENIPGFRFKTFSTLFFTCIMLCHLESYNVK